MDRYTESENYKTTGAAEPLRKSTEFEALQYRLQMEKDRAYQINQRVLFLLGKFVAIDPSGASDTIASKPFGLMAKMDQEIDFLHNILNQTEDSLNILEKII